MKEKKMCMSTKIYIYQIITNSTTTTISKKKIKLKFKSTFTI